MRVQLVSLRETEAARAAGRPSLTPELLAATGARYSRNNEGLDAILARIDPQQPDDSVDGIFRMIDYGHQSIADMAPLAMFIDGISILLATLVWNWSPYAGGQESSTRYIRLAPEGLIDPEELGIPEKERVRWRGALLEAFQHYSELEAWWRELSEKRPELLRIPENILAANDPKTVRQVARMRRNYAFDRARYWLPAASATNMMLVMSARAWAMLCQRLRSSLLREARSLGEAIHAELRYGAPRLMSHATAKESFASGMRREFDALVTTARAGVPPTLRGSSINPAHPATPSLDVMMPENGGNQMFADDLCYHDNRYAWLGAGLQRTAVRFAWEAVSLGEIRDLNRHRTGTRHLPLLPRGFYGAVDQVPENLVSGACHEHSCALRSGVEFGGRLTREAFDKLAAGDPTYLYWTTLGTQFPFEHTTTADKFIYEAELRTGIGAHFRYAQHLGDALELWYERFPATRGLVLEGGAEPE